MTDQATIAQTAKVLAAAAPGAYVILFGSYARGDAQESSDLDFLVVEPELKSRRDEMVRLRDVLRPLRVPVDVVVTKDGHPACDFNTVWARIRKKVGLPDVRVHDLRRNLGSWLASYGDANLPLSGAITRHLRRRRCIHASPRTPDSRHWRSTRSAFRKPLRGFAW